MPGLAPDARGALHTDGATSASYVELFEGTLPRSGMDPFRSEDAPLRHILQHRSVFEGLINRGGADIITVSSGIGFLPLPVMPAYGASKVGVHAYTDTLRPQVAGVTVTELVPPAVATAGQEKVNPVAPPPDGFLDEVFDLIIQAPTPNQVIVQAAQLLRWAERDGTYAELLEARSPSLSALPGR